MWCLSGSVPVCSCLRNESRFCRLIPRDEKFGIAPNECMFEAPKSPRLCYVCGKWCSLTSYHENHSGMFPHCSKRAHRNSFTAMNSRGRYEPCRWLLSSKWLFFQRVPLSWLFDIQRMENNQRRGVLAVWNRRNRCSDSVSRHQWLFASLKRLML